MLPNLPIIALKFNSKGNVSFSLLFKTLGHRVQFEKCHWMAKKIQGKLKGIVLFNHRSSS